MIGFDIGGTKCAVTVGRETDGRLVVESKRQIPTDHTASPYELLDRMCALAREQTDDFDVIGISCGGPLNSADGVILSPPNLPGWDNVRIVDFLEERFGCRAYLQNDANACAVAEWKYGAGVGMNNMVFMTFGTGLGAGLILNGRLYSGASDMAGEVGHIRLERFGPSGYGKIGSFEGFCSGGGLAELGRMYAKEAFQKGITVSYCENPTETDKITAKKIADCANAGATDAIGIFDVCAERLGMGLSIIIDILNPEAIIIGSIFQCCEGLLRRRAEEIIKKEALAASADVCKILPAKLGDSIGDYAALSVAAMNRKSG